MSRNYDDQDFGNLSARNLSLADFEDIEEAENFSKTRADQGRKAFRVAVERDRLERQGRLEGGGRRSE